MTDDTNLALESTAIESSLEPATGTTEPEPLRLADLLKEMADLVNHYVLLSS